MCGIAGFVQSRAIDLEGAIVKMTTALSHRGPDNAGYWIDPRSRIVLGHRRLAIIDTSQDGNQPMHSASGRYAITYNGEIFNYQEIAQDLAKIGYQCRTKSDTEVMLASFEHWGLEAAVNKFIGMFAFALWDKSNDTLYLVRDRLGIKPLYYGWSGGAFLFASELKGIRAHPAFDGRVSREALNEQLRFGYVPIPMSIYEGIFKLAPATIASFALSVLLNHGASNTEQRPPGNHHKYWDLETVAQNGQKNRLDISDLEIEDKIESALSDAIRLRMISDVPIGAFLSGGIDSSLVVALMQRQSSQKVRTFTIGFRESAYDEAAHARAIAQHLGTNHTELYLQAQDALNIVPTLPSIYDEPFSDSSQIPTLLVSRLARTQVTVALSGDGADELFGGYNRYVWLPKIAQLIRFCPSFLSNCLAAGITSVAPHRWDKLFAIAEPILPAELRARLAGEKIHKIARILGAQSTSNAFLRLITQWEASDDLVIMDRKSSANFDSRLNSSMDLADSMMLADTTSYLPDDILTKVDRASMAASLEGRVPFLDHRLVELAWRIPLSAKIRNGRGKWVLRKILEKSIPAVLFDRPKTGFGLPIGAWLRGPLRDWAESLLGADLIKEQGYLRAGPIQAKWKEHCTGRRDWHHHIWNVLMFQAWLAEYRL